MSPIEGTDTCAMNRKPFAPVTIDHEASKRTLGEIRADILALERETEGLLDEIIGGAD